MPARIAVIYSSTYGHIRTLAEKVAEGARIGGATVDILQIPEILSADVLAKQHAAPKADYPNVTADQLVNYDGFLFGFPTRYGRAVGSFSAWADTTGAQWAQGQLIGKSAGFFTSTGGQHGGQETTILTTIPFLAHHGIAYVPLGYGNSHLNDLTEIVGGSPWGSAAIAGGDGSRGLTEKELHLGAYQGEHFAKFVNTFVAGKAAQAAQVADIPAGTVAAKVAPESTAYDVPTTTDGTTEVKPTPLAAPVEPVVVPTPVSKAPEKVVAAKSSGGGGLFGMCCGGKKTNFDT